VLDLGSGTGIAGLSSLKFIEGSNVIMTDYTEEILGLLRENASLLPGKECSV
jgi:methylase of polypeptide subunit release factors